MLVAGRVGSPFGRGTVSTHVGGPENQSARVPQTWVDVRPARRADVRRDYRRVDDGVILQRVIVAPAGRLPPHAVLFHVRQDLVLPAGLLCRVVHRVQRTGRGLRPDRTVRRIPPAGTDGR